MPFETWRRPRGVTLFAVLTAIAACALPSKDEFSGGKAANSLPDAGADAATPAVTDAAVDSGADEGGEAAAPACPPSAVFCDQFESTPIQAQWDHLFDDDGLIFRAEGVSGRALGVNLGVRDGSKSFYALLEQPMGLEARKPFTVSFDVNASAVEGVGIVDFDCFRFHNPFFVVGLRIASYGTGGVVHYYGDPIGGGDSLYEEIRVDRLPAKAWVHIACAVTFPSADPNVRISYDGRDIFNAEIPASAYVGKPFLTAGVTKTENAGAALTVRFDDIVVTSP